MAQVDIFERKLALLAEGRLVEALAEAVPGRTAVRKGVSGPEGDNSASKGEAEEMKAEPSLEQQKGAQTGSGGVRVDERGLGTYQAEGHKGVPEQEAGCRMRKGS